LKALKSSAVTERFATDNAVGGGGPSSEYAAFIKSEQAIWSDIVKRLQEESFKALKSSAVTERFATDNAVGGGGPSSEYAAFIKSEQVIWSDIVKRAGIKPD